MRVAEPAASPTGKTLLLLHGAKFNARTWDEGSSLRTTQTMAALGHRVVAVDLPSKTLYGLSAELTADKLFSNRDHE